MKNIEDIINKIKDKKEQRAKKLIGDKHTVDAILNILNDLANHLKENKDKKSD